MDTASRTGGLDRTDDWRDRNRTRKLDNPTIGIIGKSVLNDHEKEALLFIGRCIGRLGHRLAFIPAKGTAEQVREGAAAEGAELLQLERDVIGTADHTLIYPDKRLLARLLNAYPNLEANVHVAVIREEQLDDWRDAVTQVLTDKDIPIPE